MRIKIFLVESNEDPICPVCGSSLKYRDHVPRIVKTRGGDVSWIHIRRLKCTNDNCQKLHRELPDKLAPYKHFETDVISGVLEGNITPDTKGYEDHPCEATMQSWHHWLNANRLMIDGTLKSAGYRLLGFTEELLTASVSLLDRLKSDTSDWIKIILILKMEGRVAPVLEARWYDHQEASIVEDCYHRAILKYGKCSAVYHDNGKQFVSRDLLNSLSRLGIRVLRAKPYSPQSKGGVEVFNRFVNAFLAEAKAQKIHTMEDLKRQREKNIQMQANALSFSSYGKEREDHI